MYHHPSRFYGAFAPALHEVCGCRASRHGTEVVPSDESVTWTAVVNLDPGGNLIPITAVDEYGESSDPAYGFVDKQMYVRLTGDTMTGALQLDNAGTTGGIR